MLPIFAVLLFVAVVLLAVQKLSAHARHEWLVHTAIQLQVDYDEYRRASEVERQALTTMVVEYAKCFPVDTLPEHLAHFLGDLRRKKGTSP